MTLNNFLSRVLFWVIFKQNSLPLRKYVGGYLTITKSRGRADTKLTI